MCCIRTLFVFFCLQETSFQICLCFCHSLIEGLFFAQTSCWINRTIFDGWKHIYEFNKSFILKGSLRTRSVGHGVHGGRRFRWWAVVESRTITTFWIQSCLGFFWPNLVENHLCGWSVSERRSLEQLQMVEGCICKECGKLSEIFGKTVEEVQCGSEWSWRAMCPVFSWEWKQFASTHL